MQKILALSAAMAALNIGFAADAFETPKVMGKDYWTVLRSSDGPYADPAYKLNAANKKTGLADLPLFRECALRHGCGRHNPTNPAWASWRKVIDNFPGGTNDWRYLMLEANAKPNVPVFMGFGPKRSYHAQVGKIDLDYDDYRAWKARHPNLVSLLVGDEWANDIFNMDTRFHGSSCTNIWKTQAERDEIKARLFSFPYTHEGMLRRARAYFEHQFALYWNDADLLYMLRECLCVDHVAAAWGTKILAMETTNTSGGGYEEFRWDVQGFFTRGAARQFTVPWKWYVAQFVDGYTHDGKFEVEIMCNNSRNSGNPRQRPTGGCSPSLVRRICYYAYLNGANFVEIEDWGQHLLIRNDEGGMVLSPRGEDFAAYHDFTREHPNRGETFAPVAILLPFDQGYTYCGGFNWRTSKVGYRKGDHLVDALFFTIVSGSERGKGVLAGKEYNLHNTPMAMMYDVLVPDSPQPKDAFLKQLKKYPVAILAGEYPKLDECWKTIEEYVRNGGTLLMPKANWLLVEKPVGVSTGEAAPKGSLEWCDVLDAPQKITDPSGKLMGTEYALGKGKVIVSASDWMTPPFEDAKKTVADTLRGARKFPEVEFFLKRFQKEHFPFEVTGKCQYGANKTKDGWWLWALNNDGVTKFTDTFAEVDARQAHTITVGGDVLGAPQSRLEITELITGRKIPVRDGKFTWTIPAGDLAIFEINERAATPKWNASDRATTKKWFLENEYGVRPSAAEKPEVKFEQVGVSDLVLGGKAKRKVMKATVRGPYGEMSFPFYVFIPTAAKQPVSTFVFMGLMSRRANPDLAKNDKAWPVEQIIDRGYATVGFNCFDVAPDAALGCAKGVFACYDKPWTNNCCRPHTAWGTLSAWAWGMSRMVDYIETDKALDAKHIAVVGHSRGGKTALLAGVTDERIAMACVNDSGCSGAKLNRLDLPKSENIAIITRTFPYWFCSNYRLWVNRDREIPYDQHQLLALMAPRLVAVASATQDDWAGQRGEYESCVLASGAWEALGKKGLVSSGFPKPGEAQQGGSISYHLREGKHSLDPFDWQRYMDFADAHGWAMR